MIKFFFKETIGLDHWRYLHVHHIRCCNKTLGLNNANYAQWHTERAPSGKKVNYVEEISSLNDKVDMIMSMLAIKHVPIDPNNVP